MAEPGRPMMVLSHELFSAHGPKDTVERQIGMQGADLAVKSETATAAAHAARDGDGGARWRLLISLFAAHHRIALTISYSSLLHLLATHLLNQA